MSQNNGQQFNLGIKHSLFNNEIRKRRLELGLTQDQLSEMAGINVQTVGHLETFRRYPQPREAQKLAEFFDVKVEVLFPEWIKEFVGKKTTVVTEHLVTERMLEHPELRLLPAVAGSTEEFEDKIDRELLQEVTMEALDTLPSPRIKRTLEMRFGLNGERPMTLEEVANEFGVTRERIRQIEAKGIRMLKHPTRVYKLAPFALSPEEYKNRYKERPINADSNS